MIHVHELNELAFSKGAMKATHVKELGEVVVIIEAREMWTRNRTRRTTGNHWIDVVVDTQHAVVVLVAAFLA